LELADGGYAWFDLVSTTPSKQKPFDEVKAEVATLVKEQERRREITAFASKIVERLNAGEAIETIAKEAGAKVEKSNPFNRSTSPHGIPQGAVQQAFVTPKGRATSAPTQEARMILRVADIIPAPAATPEQLEKLKADLARQMQSDALAQYLGGLQTLYGLKVNETALRQALGEDRSQPAN
jgi:peptidyl-prolyl cis-trans isomerase D